MPTINAFPIQTKRVIDLEVMAGSDISEQDKTLVYDQSLGLWKSVTIAESAYYSSVVFNTPAQSALASLPVGAKYSTKGADAVGDGGHGDFIVEAASGTPDGYSRVLLANGNHGVLQPVNGAVNLLQFGADISDCAPALIRMHNFANANGFDVVACGSFGVNFTSAIPVKTNCDYSRCELAISNSTAVTTCFEIQQKDSSIVISSPSATEFKKGATFLTALVGQPKGFVAINSTDVYLLRNGTDPVYKRDVNYHTGDGKLAYPLNYDWTSIATVTIKVPEAYQLEFKAPAIIAADCTISNFILCGRNQTKVYGAKITNNRTIAGAPIVTYLNPQLVMDCVLDGKYGDALTGISGVNGSTYDYSGGSVLRPTVLNVRNGGEWGAIDGNVYRDLFVDNCIVSRVGCHASAVGVTVKNTVITEKAIQVTGSGLLLVQNCKKVITGQPGADGGIGTLVDLREDYGGEWDGDIVVEDFEISCGNANLTDAQFGVVRLNFKGDTDYDAPLRMARSIRIERGTITTSTNASTNASMYLVEVFRYTQSQTHIVRTLPEQIKIKDVKIITASGSPVTSVRPYRSPLINSANVSGNTEITVDNVRFDMPISSLPLSQLGRSVRVEATAGEISGATHAEFYTFRNMKVDALFRAPPSWTLSCQNCEVYNFDNFFNSIQGEGYTEARNSKLYPGRYSGTAPKAYFNCEARQGGGSTAVQLSGGFKRAVGNSIQAGVTMTFAVPLTKTDFVSGFYDATYYEPL